MAEPVNPTQTPQPPTNTTPSTSTPSQPLQMPHAPSPSLQQSFAPSNSTLAPQQHQFQPQPQPQPPPSQSPAPPTMAPSTQPTTNNNHTIPSTTYPTRAPPGAPGRNYLNTHLAPYLRTGMNNILDTKPQYPLRWLGEYLISQSLIHEGGTDEKGVVERFIYEEHGVAVKKARPESTSAVVQGFEQEKGAEQDGEDGVGEERTEADQALGAVAGGQGAGTGEDTEMGGS